MHHRQVPAESSSVFYSLQQALSDVSFSSEALAELAWMIYQLKTSIENISPVFTASVLQMDDLLDLLVDTNKVGL